MILILDENECSRPDWNNCDVNAQCENTEGFYECSCDPGYLDMSYGADGRICISKLTAI